MITEQDTIVKELQNHILSELDGELSKQIRTLVPLIMLEDGMVQVDPRFTTHA